MEAALYLIPLMLLQPDNNLKYLQQSAKALKEVSFQRRKAELLQNQQQQQEESVKHKLQNGAQVQYSTPHIIVGPDGHHLMPLSANFENEMEHNINSPAVIHQNYGDVVKSTHFQSIGNVSDPLPQASTAVVQNHLNDNVQLSTTDALTQAPLTTNSVQEVLHHTAHTTYLDANEARAQATVSGRATPATLSANAAAETDSDHDDTSSIGDDLSSSTEFLKLRTDYENKLKVAKKSI